MATGNLFDIIQQNKNSLTGAGAVPATAGGVSDTASVQNLMQAKSGKAVTPGSGQPLSNLGEQSANATTQLGLNQVGQQAEVQNQALQTQSAGVKQQEQQGVIGAQQARAGNDLQTRIQVEATLSDLERNKGAIRQNQDSAALESVAATLRLQNQEYVDNLTRTGNEARLNDELQFKDQLQTTLLGDQKDALSSALNDKNILDFNDNQFKELMGQMTTDQAWNIYNTGVSAAKGRAGWEALGSITSAGSLAAGGTSSNTNQTNSQSMAGPDTTQQSGGYDQSTTQTALS